MVVERWQPQCSFGSSSLHASDDPYAPYAYCRRASVCRTRWAARQQGEMPKWLTAAPMRVLKTSRKGNQPSIQNLLNSLFAAKKKAADCAVFWLKTGVAWWVVGA